MWEDNAFKSSFYDVILKYFKISPRIFLNTRRFARFYEYHIAKQIRNKIVYNDSQIVYLEILILEQKFYYVEGLSTMNGNYEAKYLNLW